MNEWFVQHCKVYYNRNKWHEMFVSILIAIPQFHLLKNYLKTAFEAFQLHLFKNYMKTTFEAYTYIAIIDMSYDKITKEWQFYKTDGNIDLLWRVLIIQ